METIGFENIIKKLNNAVFAINRSKKSFEEKSKVKFLCGEIDKALEQIIKLKAPFGKVLFVSGEDNYQKFSFEISNAIKKAGAKYFGLTINSNKFETPSSLAELFNFPEDIRLVITTDGELTSKVSYFCEIKNIPVVVVPVNSIPLGYLDPYIIIDNGNSLDAVKLNPEKYVVFSEQMLLGVDKASLYAHIVSKLVAVKDYIVNNAVNGKKPNKQAYSIVKNSIYQTINLATEKDGISSEDLLSNAFLIETINNLTQGNMCSFSADAISATILSASGKEFLEAEIKCAIKILELYGALINENEAEILLMPDYNKRAESLSKLLSIPETAVLKGFLAQLEILINGKRTAEVIVKRLKNEIKKEMQSKSKILKAYYNLGGLDTIENDDINNSVKHAGDFPFGINLMSIARENGITEVI